MLATDDLAALERSVAGRVITTADEELQELVNLKR